MTVTIRGPAVTLTVTIRGVAVTLTVTIKGVAVTLTVTIRGLAVTLTVTIRRLRLSNRGREESGVCPDRLSKLLDLPNVIYIYTHTHTSHLVLKFVYICKLIL